MTMIRLDGRDGDGNILKTIRNHSQRIHGATWKTEDGHLSFSNGIITARVAMAIKDLILSPFFSSAWTVELRKCWAESHEVGQMLSRSFHRRVRELRVLQLDEYSLTGRYMFDLIFGCDSACHEIRSNFTLRSLTLVNVTLNREMASRMKKWARCHKSLDWISLSGDFAFYGGFSSFLSIMYDGIPHKPRGVSFSDYTDVNSVGDLSLFNKWSTLEELHFDSGCIEILIEGKFARLSQLKSLSFTLMKGGAGDPLDETGLVGLLRRKDCKISSLYLVSVDINTSGLIRSLYSNNSVKVLNMSRTRVDADGLDAMVEFIEQSRTVREISCQPKCEPGEVMSDLACRITQLLSTTNSNLQSLFVGASIYNSNIGALLLRNWAGRRILASDSAVPCALWPVVLRRVNRHLCGVVPDLLTKNGENDMVPLRVAIGRADCIYHLLRNGPLLFNAN